MPKALLATPMDPEMGGIGYYEYIFGEGELAAHFAFFGLPLVNTREFASDHGIVFRDERLEVEVHNSDEGDVELGTENFETVLIHIYSKDKSEVDAFIAKLGQTLRLHVLSKDDR